MTEKPKLRRQPNLTIYLGDPEKRLKRTAKLDEIAASFGVTRSVLMQKIADGELVVVKKV